MVAADLQIRFTCYSKFSLLSISTPQSFTCFALSIIMDWIFPEFKITLFSLN